MLGPVLDGTEEWAISMLVGALERILMEPFSPNYDAFLDDERLKVAAPYVEEAVEDQL